MSAVDTERFRLRRFVERLVQLGKCEIHDKPIDLVDVAAVLEGNPMFTLLAFGALIMFAGRLMAWPVEAVTRLLLLVTGNM